MPDDPVAPAGWSDSRAVLAELSGEVPPALRQRADSWSADSVPADPRLAASVLLVRDAIRPTGPGAGLEAYLLHRHARMAFAPSMVVFPGGGAEPGEALRACAVRETREETGVVLDPAALVDWAHWITPEFEPRRYDTRFYVAALPAGQEPADVSGETDRAGWQTPTSALADADQGRIALMPPTRSLLLELSRQQDVRALLAAGVDRAVQPVLPRLARTGDGWRFVYPGTVRPEVRR